MSPLRVFCVYKTATRAGGRNTIATPHVEVDGRVIEGFKINYGSTSARGQCINRFFDIPDSGITLKRIQFYNGDKYIPLTVNQILALHHMKLVPNTYLQNLCDTLENFEEFSEQVETRAIIEEFAR